MAPGLPQTSTRACQEASSPSEALGHSTVRSPSAMTRSSRASKGDLPCSSAMDPTSRQLKPSFSGAKVSPMM